MASLLVFFVVCLSSIASGQQFKRIDQCGRYTRLNNPYSTGQAYSNIECTEQCLGDNYCVAVTSCGQDKTRWRTCEKSNNLAGLHNCNNHEMNEKCSTWEKVDPCKNGAALINGACVCVLPYKGVTCQFYQPVSCSEIRQMSLNTNQTAVSKTYFLYTSSQKCVEVFCDFKNESFGAMYISKSSLDQLTRSELKELVPDNRMFILRGKQTDLAEKEFLVSMLPSYQNRTWSIMLRVDTALFEKPVDNIANYIYIGGIPRAEISNITEFGFVADNTVSKQTCNDNSPANYFIFHTNQTSMNQSYQPTTCIYWQKFLKTNCTHKLPSDDYFYFPEIHFKCMAWCTAIDFYDLIGFTPGFLFE